MTTSFITFYIIAVLMAAPAIFFMVFMVELFSSLKIKLTLLKWKLEDKAHLIYFAVKTAMDEAALNEVATDIKVSMDKKRKDIRSAPLIKSNFSVKEHDWFMNGFDVYRNMRFQSGVREERIYSQ